MTKVSIIGSGNLGAGIANEIAGRNITEELVLVDILPDLALGQALDILQGLPYRNCTKVSAGNYEAIKNSDIIVLTAGKPRTPDIKDRLQLAEINFNIVGKVLAEIKKNAPNSIIITITNPMDLINHFIHKSGFPQNKVIGSGGQLDSSRLRTVLGHPQQEVEAYVLGEHGESQIPVFSKIKINGKVKSYSISEQEDIRQKIKQSSLEVIQKKGATVFAPASNTVDMVEAIFKDQKRLLICSANLQGEYGLKDISLGVPCILGWKGLEKVEVWNLTEEELKELQRAGNKLKEAYSQITNKI